MRIARTAVRNGFRTNRFEVVIMQDLQYEKEMLLVLALALLLIAVSVLS